MKKPFQTHTLLLGLLMGISLGSSGTTIINHYRFTTFHVPKFKVGDCLGNGLFFQKVLEVKKYSALKEALYMTKSYFACGRTNDNVDAVETWIADNRYTKVDDKNCKEKK